MNQSSSNFLGFKPIARKCTLILMGAASLIFQNAAMANLLLNGSFEDPALAVGTSYVNAPVGSSVLPGWSVLGPQGIGVAIIESDYNLPDNFGYELQASDGRQWIDLTGAGVNDSQGVGQTVNLVPGHYHLTFDVGNISLAGVFGPASSVALLLNGEYVATFSNQNTSPYSVNWVTYSFNFEADGNTTISFFNADLHDDNLNGLDNVVLSAVPEPNGLWLSFFGGIGVLAMYRHRGGRL